MVYRGKPSAGCENCRKAKKRCGLEQPACLRCVQLKKVCTGYRDTSQLQIQDESAAVRQKAERHKAKKDALADGGRLLAAPVMVRFAGSTPSAGALTPMSMSSSSSNDSDSTVDIEAERRGHAPIQELLQSFNEPPLGPVAIGTSLMLKMTDPIRPKPEDIASTYFLTNLTVGGQWDTIVDIAKRPKLDPCLEFAVRACGMAALNNKEFVPGGRAYARVNYGEALKLLNEALRDAQRSRSDEALIAVTMLGYYENVMFEGVHSFGSWKAHAAGAAQMLRLRGKAQLDTHVGRSLFREIRSQIIVSSLWDDQDVPSFLLDYQRDLEAKTEEDFHGLWKLADKLTAMYYRLARLRKNMFTGAVPVHESIEDAADLECDLLQWSADALAESEYWRYHELEVADSPHVWDGKVFAYAGNPAPMVWNHWRMLRLLVSRCQEGLCRRLCVSEDELTEQQSYFRGIRRGVVDGICATIPACLGHAAPAFNSPCVLVTAHGAVWALFFAATALVERVGPDAKYILYGLTPPANKPQNVAYAQLSWVMGRLRYISNDVGFKWADGIAGILRAEGRLRGASAPRVTMADRALWLRNVQ